MTYYVGFVSYPSMASYDLKAVASREKTGVLYITLTTSIRADNITYCRLVSNGTETNATVLVGAGGKSMDPRKTAEPFLYLHSICSSSS